MKSVRCALKLLVFTEKVSAERACRALGNPILSKLGESTKLADLTIFSDFEEGMLTLNMAGGSHVV